MMKLAWMTDIHLNFLEKEERYEFYQEIINSKSDGVLISGDIAEANSVVDLLTEMSEQVKNPIYFVAGNHDYYRGQIDEVRARLKLITEQQNNLYWLPAIEPQNITENTILLGQDGWADGRLGDYHQSTISLNDSRMIADLFQEKVLGKEHLLKKMQELADKDATMLKHNLSFACEQGPKKIIILTHVPPFKETCLHMGKISDDNWLPYFTSKATGDVILDFAIQHKEINFLVLCGHTHSKANYQPLENLQIKVGQAEYYEPGIEELIVV